MTIPYRTKNFCTFTNTIYNHNQLNWLGTCITWNYYVILIENLCNHYLLYNTFLITLRLSNIVSNKSNIIKIVIKLSNYYKYQRSFRYEAVKIIILETKWIEKYYIQLVDWYRYLVRDIFDTHAIFYVPKKP